MVQVIKSSDENERMQVREALQVLADVRKDTDIVITNQGASRVWPLIDEHPLDFHYNPSTMGGAVPFALGLALACAPREVIVVSGDGALLMSLGSLASVVASGARNITVVVLENGIYEVTGGQKTPAAGANVDFAGLASSLGFECARSFNSIVSWRNTAASVLRSPGPRMITLHVAPALPADLATRPTPLSKQIAALVQRLR